MLTAEEHRTVREIADRAARLYERMGVEVKPVYIETELVICHDRICPLRLKSLLEADDMNFAHDIGGIHRHADLVAEKMRDCFVPRFAASTLDAMI